MLTRDQADASREAIRTRITWLIIAASAAVMFARLATVESPRGGTPLLSANDRSRWSTIRSLVDHGTYVLDHVIFRAPGKRDPNWYSIDLVRHRGPNGKQHYYSSKPTLLTTLAAAPYWLLNKVGGLTLVSKTFYVVRITLLLLHVLPMVLLLVLLAWIVEGLAANEWSKLFAVTAASFATPLTTFSVTLNNHLPAAVCVMIGIWAVMKIWREPVSGLWLYLLAGFSAAMTAACELPGLSFLAIIGTVLLWKSPRKALVGSLPPVFLVAAGVVGTNYLAHGIWSTAYAHRNDGPVLVTVPEIDSSFVRPGQISPALQQRLSAAGLRLPLTATVAERPLNRGLVLWNPEDEQQYAMQLRSSRLEVRQWNNWYEYPGSYWSSGKKTGC